MSSSPGKRGRWGIQQGQGWGGRLPVPLPPTRCAGLVTYLQDPLRDLPHPRTACATHAFCSEEDCVGNAACCAMVCAPVCARPKHLPPPCLPSP